MQVTEVPRALNQVTKANEFNYIHRFNIFRSFTSIGLQKQPYLPLGCIIIE